MNDLFVIVVVYTSIQKFGIFWDDSRLIKNTGEVHAIKP